MDLTDFDSTTRRADAARLRERFRGDGFLYFRQLLKPAEVMAIRREVIDRLRKLGWLAAEAGGDDAVPGAVAHHDRGMMHGKSVVDPGWRQGYEAVQSLESLHRLGHHPLVRAVIASLLGGRAIVHPRKIARISFPGLVYPTPPHQDALFNQVPADVITAWIPLGDCPAELGALRVLRGSAQAGLRPLSPDNGLGGESVDVPVDDPRWVEGDYRCGDVILFHSQTVHMTGPNRGETVRLSMDCRYQSADDPIKAAALMPHGYAAGQLPGWGELTRGWTCRRWVEVDEPVQVAATPHGHPQRSRIFGELRDGPERKNE